MSARRNTSFFKVGVVTVILIARPLILPVSGVVGDGFGTERRSVDIVLAHQRPKSSSVFLRSARRHGDIAGVSAQRRSDVGAFEALDDLAFGRAEGLARGRTTRRRRNGERFELGAAAVQYGGA